MDLKSARALGVPLAVIAIGVALLIALFLSITVRLSELRNSPSDNLTWTLSQVEVDVLKLNLATQQVRADPSIGLSPLRRRFNSAFSRADTIATGPIFAMMRDNPKFAAQLDALRTCFDKLAVIVDSPDAQAMEQLPTVSRLIAAILDDARAVSLIGVELTAQASDGDRRSLTKLLVAVEFVSACVILLLGSVVLFIFRQSRVSARISEQAQQANLRLKSTFDVSLDAIVVADSHGTVLEFNAASEEVFGFMAAEAIGAKMTDLIVPPEHRDAHDAGMARLNQTGEPKLVGQGRIEITALRKSGEEFPVEISIGQAEDDRGPIYIAYLRDITQRKEVEINLKRTRDEAIQAEAAKSNFLAVMSHEMRTPLNGVFGAVQLLKATPLTDTQINYLDIAQQSGDVLLHHVNNVLDVTRIDEGKLELSTDQFEITKFFGDVIAANNPMAKTHGNVLVSDFDDFEGVTIVADKHRLRQVLYNLIGNAVKFTENGKVIVSVSIDPTDDGAQILTFSVADTGIGIPETEQNKVFERFYTRNSSYDRMASGAGLGLTICKDLVTLMGGEIALESTEDVGTTFMVQVPVTLADGVDLVPETKKETPHHDVSGRHVLVVEDNEINRVIVRHMLETQGVEVTEAFDGAAAVAIAKKTKFDAILMDISMPVMNGVDATQAIRGSNGPNVDTVIIAVTAHAEEAEVARFLAVGMNQCLTKPVSQNNLVKVLAKVDGPPLNVCATEADRDGFVHLDTVMELAAVFDKTRLANMAQLYADEVAALFKFSSGFLAPDDFMTLAALAHKSIGSSGMIGAVGMQKPLRALEEAANSGSASGIEDALEQATRQWPACLDALNATIKQACESS